MRLFVMHLRAGGTDVEYRRQPAASSSEFGRRPIIPQRWDRSVGELRPIAVSAPD